MDKKIIHIVYFSFLFCLLRVQGNVVSNEIDDDSNPFADIASNLINSKEGMNILSNFLNSQDGKDVGGMLMQNLVQNSDLTGQVLSGLGRAFTNEKDGGLNVDMIGNVIGMFTENSSSENEIPDEPQHDKMNDEPSISGLWKDFSQDVLGNEHGAQMMSYLPMILKTLSSFNEKDRKQHEKEHAQHSWMIPPILERLHIFWDHFRQSEFGKYLFKTLNVEKFMKKFANERGNFDFDKLVELVENHSFRRYWIKKVTGTLADLISNLVDPAVQKKYFKRGTYLMNSYLQYLGYPRQALFDESRPAESLSTLGNMVLRKYFDLKTDVTPYVIPVIQHIQELINLAQEQSKALKSGITTHALADKITDTINLELIEPLLRVFRAYRYAKKMPKCDKYIMCVINQADRQANLPTIKSLLSRVSSLFASWFLTYHTNSSFWSLYNAITDSTGKCQVLYPVDCSAFHAEEIKVTTEIYHNEL